MTEEIPLITDRALLCIVSLKKGHDTSRKIADNTNLKVNYVYTVMHRLIMQGVIAATKITTEGNGAANTFNVYTLVHEDFLVGTAKQAQNAGRSSRSRAAKKDKLFRKYAEPLYSNLDFYLYPKQREECLEK